MLSQILFTWKGFCVCRLSQIFFVSCWQNHYLLPFLTGYTNMRPRDFPFFFSIEFRINGGTKLQKLFHFLITDSEVITLMSTLDNFCKTSKLKITKFERTALGWFRFWNQFRTEIDQTQIRSISFLISRNYFFFVAVVAYA